MKLDMLANRLTRQQANRRCRMCGYSISSYAAVPSRCPMCSAERSWATENQARIVVVEPHDPSNGELGL